MTEASARSALTVARQGCSVAREHAGSPDEGRRRPGVWAGRPRRVGRAVGRPSVTLASLAVALLAATSPVRGDEPDRTVELRAVRGMQYDVKRFVVRPDQRVRLVLRNADNTLKHNLVVTAPGKRLRVVKAALAMGSAGPANDYVPDVEAVLVATPVLAPGQKRSIEFTAPSEEDVYPYVCTFPGHGYVMYGAMYVSEEDPDLPPLSKDPNLPTAHMASGGEAPTARDPGSSDRASVRRLFMPDSGPASFAVGLKGGQSYCFDAGACRLRYAWRGGYIDASKFLAGSGDAPVRIEGRIYYRSRRFPLRIGSADQAPTRKEFLGYARVDGEPQFRYRVDGVEVRERITPVTDGSGLVRHFRVPDVDAPVHFLAERHAGVAYSASAGNWSDQHLRLTPEQAKRFTVTMTEKRGDAPLGSWSMDDDPWNRRIRLPVGVAGRAVPFDGRTLSTGVQPADHSDGLTVMGWTRPDDVSEKRVLFGARDDAGRRLLLGHHVGGKKGVGLVVGDAVDLRHEPTGDGWHHLAAVLDSDAARLYVDGEKVVEHEKRPALPASELHVGGEDGFPGRVDEVRIYDRALELAEIRRVRQRDMETPARRYIIQPVRP